MALLAGGCEKLLDLQPVGPLDGRAGSDARHDGRPGVDAPPRIDAPPVDGRLTAGCPPLYNAVSFGSGMMGYYRFHSTMTTWPDAEAACEQDGVGYTMRTHLAVLGSYDEVNASQPSVVPNSTTAWIGLSSRKDHQNFLWVTGEGVAFPPSTGTPWATNYPDHSVGAECVYLDGLAALKNGSCNTPLMGFVCECDMYPAIPGNYTP